MAVELTAIPNARRSKETGRDYGVAEAHYDTVGAALLWTLEMGLGTAFTAETREAWTAVYGLLATTMKDAARETLAAA